MKIRNTFLSAVLLVFVNEIQAKGASLNSLIEELAPIARLTNGIAIETELSADANKMNDVVAEFLRVGSGDDVAKLKELRVDEVAKELGELYATVEKVPELNVDMAALADTFKALEHMKQSSDVLSRKLTDSSDELQRDLDLGKTIHPFYLTDLKNLKGIVEELEFVMSNDDFDKVGNVKSDHLVPLDASLKHIDSRFPNLKDFEKAFEALLKLQNISEKLHDFGEMAKLSKLFIDNFKMLSSMSTKLSEVQTGISSLKTVIDTKKSVPELAKDLSETFDAVKKLTNATAALKLTAGFSGGVGDLKLIFDDLKSGKLKSLVAKGKDTKDLQMSLSSLASIHSGLEMLVNTWSQLRQPKRTDSLGNLGKILEAVLESDQKSSDIAVLASSLGPLKDCFKNLKLPDIVPDSKIASELLEFAKKLGIRVGVMKQFLETQKTAIESVSTAMNPLITLLDPIKASITTGDFKVAWYGIRNNNKTAFIIKESKKIYDAYEKIEDQLPFDTVKEAVDLSVIPAVLKISNGTNLDVMLSCLQKNSYDANLMGSTLNFGKSVQVMKSMKTEFNSTQTFLTELSSMKSELHKVEKLMKPNQQPKPRRRRAPNQKSLANLKNAPTVAADLGKGVQVLREFAKILENEASVQVAVNADDGLKNAISAIPGVQSVWTDENRKGMGKMVVDLKELDKFAGSVKMDNMTSLWQIFDEAQKTDGVVGVDAKVFEDPISTVLAASSDPKIKGVSGDFKNLGALDLDFAQHKINLKAASFTLQPLQQFFDDYFGNTKTSGGTVLQTVTVSTSDSGILFIVLGVLGGIGLFVVVGVVAWCLWKRHKRILRERELEKLLKEEQDKKWENRERYWIYEEFYDDDDSLTNLPLAIQDQKFEIAKELIGAGCLMDTYHDGFTALHWAVDNALPDVVEYLIRHGADRSLPCFHKIDALGLVARRLLDETDYKAKWKNLHKIKQVFKKYEKRNFRPKVRNLLPLNRFNIKIVSSDPKLAKVVQDFNKTYDQYLAKEGSTRISHVVVDTDEDGCFNFDKSLIAKKALLKADLDRKAEERLTLTKSERKALEPTPNVDDPDDLESYEYFFSSVNVIKSSWLADCLANKDNLYRDYDHRVTKVRLNKKVYETVDEWKKWMRRRAIQCLRDVEVHYAFYRTSDDNTDVLLGHDTMKTVLKRLCATWMTLDGLVRESSERTWPPPFWFPEKRKQWILYSPQNKEDVDRYIENYPFDRDHEADRETQYLKMSVIEFFEFLFSMNGFKDLKLPPTPPQPQKKPKDTKSTTSKTGTA